MHARAPARLTKRLTPAQTADVMRWWRALAPGARDALRDGGRAPAGVTARFVEPGSDEPRESCDYYEYLVNHEITLDDGRRFHICSAHAEARRAVASGRISARFCCPRADRACPLRALLDTAPGRDLLLSLRVNGRRARGEGGAGE